MRLVPWLRRWFGSAHLQNSTLPRTRKEIRSVIADVDTEAFKRREYRGVEVKGEVVCLVVWRLVSTALVAPEIIDWSFFWKGLSRQ